MFNHITAPALIAPSTTTGHTEETPTLTPEKEATALTNLLFISCSHWSKGSLRAPLFVWYIMEFSLKILMMNFKLVAQCFISGKD